MFSPLFSEGEVRPDTDLEEVSAPFVTSHQGLLPHFNTWTFPISGNMFLQDGDITHWGKKNLFGVNTTGRMYTMEKRKKKISKRWSTWGDVTQRSSLEVRG